MSVIYWGKRGWRERERSPISQEWVIFPRLEYLKRLCINGSSALKGRAMSRWCLWKKVHCWRHQENLNAYLLFYSCLDHSVGRAITMGSTVLFKSKFSITAQYLNAVFGTTELFTEELRVMLLRCKRWQMCDDSLGISLGENTGFWVFGQHPPKPGVCESYSLCFHMVTRLRQGLSPCKLNELVENSLFSPLL